MSLSSTFRFLDLDQGQSEEAGCRGDLPVD